MDKIKFIQLLLIFIISAAFPCNYKSLELNLKNGNTNEEYEVDITLENMHLCIDKVICRKTNEEHDIIDAKIMIPGKKDYRFQKNAWIQTAAETSVKEEDMQALAKEKDRPCFSRGCASLLKHEKGEKIGKIELPFPSEIKENLKNSTVMIKSSLKDACLQIVLKLDNPFYNTESKILESSGSNLEKCLFSGLEPEGFAEELKEGCVHFRNLLKLTVDSYIKKTDASEISFMMPDISYDKLNSYTRKYFRLFHDSDVPVLMQKNCKNSKTPKKHHEKLTDDERKKIVLNAEKYLNCMTEYTLPATRNSKSIAFSSQNPIPVPYAKNGMDTPNTFKYKMEEKKANGTPFIPGGFIDSIRTAGTDSMGLLTGVLSSSGLAGKIPLHGQKDKLSLFYDYDNNIKDYLKTSKTYLNTRLSLYSEDYKITSKDISQFASFIPEKSLIREGDILISAKKNFKAAIIAKTSGKKNKDEIEVITIQEKENGTATKCKWSELEDSDSYHPYSMLKSKNSNDGDKQDLEFDIYDATCDKTDVETEHMFEEMQEAEFDKKWIFIPNTGEYLVIKGIKFNIKNRLCIPQKIESGIIDVKINLADAGENGKRNNTNGEFEINLKTENGEILKYGTYCTTQDRLYKKTGKKNLSVDSYGSIIAETSSGTEKICELHIRPLSAEKSFPGDSVRIEFEFTDSSEKMKKFTASSKDRLYVYDKKAVWRANLYVMDDNSEKSTIDWNRAHPWNAPPSKGKNADGKKMRDWASSWGYNEWNLACPSSTDDFTKLSCGDGKQVIEYSGYTPFKYQEDNGNAIYDTVAYDVQGKYSDALDTPFDFMYKIKMQSKNLAEHFKSECIKLNPELKGFPDEKPSAEVKEKLEKTGSKVLSKDAFPCKNGFIQENSYTMYNLASWKRTTAPNDRWKFYWKKSAENTDFTSFIPSLGLCRTLMDEGNATELAYASEKTSEMENISFQEAKSAGTGNICFIAQAVNYSSSKYAWLKKTSITDYAAKGNFSYEKRQKTVPYPEENTDAKTIAELEECQDLEKTRKLLSGIVPGDIVSYKDGAEILLALVSGMDREKIENASNADELYEGIFVMESINEKHECGVKKHDLSKIMARGEKSCSIKRLCIF